MSKYEITICDESGDNVKVITVSPENLLVTRAMDNLKDIREIKSNVEKAKSIIEENKQTSIELLNLAVKQLVSFDERIGNQLADKLEEDHNIVIS